MIYYIKIEMTGVGYRFPKFDWLLTNCESNQLWSLFDIYGLFKRNEHIFCITIAPDFIFSCLTTDEMCETHELLGWYLDNRLRNRFMLAVICCLIYHCLEISP